MELALKIVEGALVALAAVAPTVAEAITGGQTVEESIEAARKAAKAVPVSEDNGEWDDDLKARLERG